MNDELFDLAESVLVRAQAITAAVYTLGKRIGDPVKTKEILLGYAEEIRGLSHRVEEALTPTSPLGIPEWPWSCNLRVRRGDYRTISNFECSVDVAEDDVDDFLQFGDWAPGYYELEGIYSPEAPGTDAYVHISSWKLVEVELPDAHPAWFHDLAGQLAQFAHLHEINAVETHRGGVCIFAHGEVGQRILALTEEGLVQ